MTNHPRKPIDRVKGFAELAWGRLTAFVMNPFFALPPITVEAIAPHQLQLPPAILDDICMPPYYGPKDHDDYHPLFRILHYVKPSVVLEFGTAHGNTVANICQQSPQTRVYTVNAPVEQQTGSVTTYELDREEIGRVYRKFGFTDRVTQIFENTLTLDLSSYFAKPCIDLAIIDACHDTSYVLSDFKKIAPFVTLGGIVLLHDTHPSMRGHLSGSYIACMKLRQQGWNVKHIRGTWWGIWIKDA